MEFWGFGVLGFSERKCGVRGPARRLAADTAEADTEAKVRALMAADGRTTSLCVCSLEKLDRDSFA